MEHREKRKVEKLKQHSYFTELTKEQEKAIYSDALKIGVDASAGSGKTRVLIARILRLLKEKKADLNEIVAITFTEKSAAEMRQRLLDAFHEYARNAGPDELNQWRWREQQLESARICTIHAFCAGILRQYALKLDFDPEFRILDELQSPLFLDRFIQSQINLWIENDPKVSDLVVELSPQNFQKILETLFQYALHILPWLDEVTQCSKEEEYINRNIQRINEKYEQYLLNFVKSKTVNVWIEKLNELLEEIPEEEQTMRNVCVFYISELKRLQNAKKREDIIQIKDAILESKQKLNIKNRDVSGELQGQIKKLREDIKRTLEKEIVDLKLDDETTKQSLTLTYRMLRLFDQFYRQWVQYKRDQGVVDFDDLIHLTYDLLDKHPEVCKEIANGIKYIFIDEFQDTDHAQVRLIQLLLSANSNLSFFFVGDAKQSIYAFRNAEVKVFQEQRRSVDSDNLFSLNCNFRSAPEILNFVNTFFQETNSLSAVEEKYRPMQAHRSPYNKPRVEFLLSTPREEEKKTLKEDNVDIEAKVIAERIQSLVKGENPLMIADEKNKRLRPVCYGDFVLLFCTKNYIYKYEKALKDRGIPCFVVSSRGFFEITEVKDILNFLQVLINPYHDIALLSFLRGPFCSLSDEQITRWQMNLPLRNMLLDTSKIPDALAKESVYLRVRSLYCYFRQKTHFPIHELIQEIIDKTGYESILLGHWFGEQRIANLQKFIALTRAYQESNPISLYQFYRFVERSRDKIMEGEADLAVEAGDAVILTTIHQAKGLEYPIVVLPLLYEERQHKKTAGVNYHKEMGVIIKTKKKEDEKNNSIETIIKLQNTYDEYQEYIRLFYVALTRARDYLILSSNKKYLEEFYTKRKINSRLSLLADCFPLDDEKNTDLYHIVERKESDFSPKKKDLTKETKSMQHDLISPVSITQQYFETEPIPVTQILNFLFDDNYGEDTDEIYDNSLDMSHAERGIFYHQLLQVWDFQEENKEILSKRLLSIVTPDISEDIIKREKDVCISKIVDNPIYPILKVNPPIWREIPFIWRTGGYFIQGTVDAILADGTVIDYKTGAHADSHALRYWKQLEIYYYAMKDLGIKVNNKLILVYIDQLKYDIKDIEVSGRDILETEINHAIKRYIKKINQGY